MRMTFALCVFVSPVLQPLVLHCFSTHTWSITRLIDQPSLTCRTGVHKWTVHIRTVCGSGLTAVCFCSPLMWGAVRGAGPQCFHLLCLFTAARFHFRFHSTPKVLFWRCLTSCHSLPPHRVIIKQNNIWPAQHQQVTSDHDLLIEDLCCSEVCFVCSAHCLCLFIKQRNLTS